MNNLVHTGPEVSASMADRFLSGCSHMFRVLASFLRSSLDKSPSEVIIETSPGTSTGLGQFWDLLV